MFSEAFSSGNGTNMNITDFMRKYSGDYTPNQPAGWGQPPPRGGWGYGGEYGANAYAGKGKAGTSPNNGPSVPHPHVEYGKYDKAFAGLTLGGSQNAPPPAEALPPQNAAFPPPDAAGELRGLEDTLAGLVLAGQQQPPPPAPLPPVQDPSPARPAGFTIGNKTLVVSDAPAPTSLPPGVRAPPAPSAAAAANRKALNVRLTDPSDGAEVVFSPLDSGACYTVNGVARPVFREAFFGKDAKGYYLEFPSIQHAVAMSSGQAPSAVRNLKAMFDACGVTHNLHRKPAPPPAAKPAPAPKGKTVAAMPAAAVPAAAMPAAAVPAAAMPAAAVPAAAKPAPKAAEKKPVTPKAEPADNPTSPGAAQRKALQQDSSVLCVVEDAPPAEAEEDKKEKAVAEEAPAAKPIMKVKQTALERAKMYQELYSHTTASGKPEEVKEKVKETVKEKVKEKEEKVVVKEKKEKATEGSSRSARGGRGGGEKEKEAPKKEAAQRGEGRRRGGRGNRGEKDAEKKEKEAAPRGQQKVKVIKILEKP